MKRYLAIPLVLSILGCSSQDAEMKLYCDYHKESFDISREANLKFKEFTPQRREWVEEQHILLREKLNIKDRDIFEQAALDKGWLPPMCKEKGYWK